MLCWFLPALYLASSKCQFKYIHAYNIYNVIYIYIYNICLDINGCIHAHIYIYKMPSAYGLCYIYKHIYKYTPSIYNPISYISDLTKDFSSMCGNRKESHLHFAVNLWSLFIVPHHKCLMCINDLCLTLRMSPTANHFRGDGIPFAKQLSLTGP